MFRRADTCGCAQCICPHSFPTAVLFLNIDFPPANGTILSMKAIGVDIVDIERIGESVGRFGDRFLKRIFTEQELAYCNNRLDSLAARWAAKEAVAKALGCGIGEIGWREIEVVSEPNRRPTLRLHGAAAELATQLGIEGFAISLSHAKEYAVAFVVGEIVR